MDFLFANLNIVSAGQGDPASAQGDSVHQDLSALLSVDPDGRVIEPGQDIDFKEFLGNAVAPAKMAEAGTELIKEVQDDSLVDLSVPGTEAELVKGALPETAHPRPELPGPVPSSPADGERLPAGGNPLPDDIPRPLAARPVIESAVPPLKYAKVEITTQHGVAVDTPANRPAHPQMSTTHSNSVEASQPKELSASILRQDETILPAQDHRSHRLQEAMETSDRQPVRIQPVDEPERSYSERTGPVDDVRRTINPEMPLRSHHSVTPAESSEKPVSIPRAEQTVASLDLHSDRPVIQAIDTQRVIPFRGDRPVPEIVQPNFDRTVVTPIPRSAGATPAMDSPGTRSVKSSHSAEIEIAVRTSSSQTAGWRIDTAASSLPETVTAATMPVRSAADGIPGDAIPMRVSEATTMPSTLPASATAAQPVINYSQAQLTPTPIAQAEVFNPGRPAGATEWGNGLGERVSWMIDQKQNSATIRLDPPILGKLDVQVRIAEDSTLITIQTQYGQTRDIVESASYRLREYLQENGYQNVNVDVSQRQDNTQSRAQQSETENEQFDESSSRETSEESTDLPALQHYVTDGLIDTFA